MKGAPYFLIQIIFKTAGANCNEYTKKQLQLPDVSFKELTSVTAIWRRTTHFMGLEFTVLVKNLLLSNLNIFIQALVTKIGENGNIYVLY